VQLRYDEDLVESAVFLCANGRRADVSPLHIHRFHRERERLYAILDPDERNAAFFYFHLDWFREWGLEGVLTAFVAEFRLLPGALRVLAFRKARSRNEEGAEMYVSDETGKNGIVALLPDRFASNDTLGRFLRHELTHLHDMVTPAFHYSPDLHLPRQTAAHQRLTRERYRLIWDITIEGRLVQACGTTAGLRRRHRADFDRAFSFWPDAKRDEVFDALWTNPCPRHDELLALASNPRGSASLRATAPGSPCPLCGFATFDWAEAGSLPAQTAQAIRVDFPQWTAEQGACGRCVDIYALRCAQSVATL